jgi:hypothetical protein
MGVDVIVSMGRVVSISAGVGIQIRDNGGVLRSVDRNRLETEDTVELDGDGGVDVSRGDAVETVWGRNQPDLSQCSNEARLELVSCSSSDSSQRKEL